MCICELPVKRLLNFALKARDFIQYYYFLNTFFTCKNSFFFFRSFFFYFLLLLFFLCIFCIFFYLLFLYTTFLFCAVCIMNTVVCVWSMEGQFINEQGTILRTYFWTSSRNLNYLMKPLYHCADVYIIFLVFVIKDITYTKPDKRQIKCA